MEKTVQEKYDLAKMGLMLIERFILALRAGHVPMEGAIDVLSQIGNMCHVINHENGEATFDCGSMEHHAHALKEYYEMYAAMLEDIANGVDYSQKISPKSREREEVDFEEVNPVIF